MQEDQEVQEAIEETNKRAALRKIACNTESALKDFKYWLNFNYPDWQVIGDISVIQASDCAFNLRFTAINPNFTTREEKDVIVVQLYYTENYDKFQVKTLRGILY